MSANQTSSASFRNPTQTPGATKGNPAVVTDRTSTQTPERVSVDHQHITPAAKPKPLPEEAFQTPSPNTDRKTSATAVPRVVKQSRGAPTFGSQVQGLRANLIRETASQQKEKPKSHGFKLESKVTTDEDAVDTTVTPLAEEPSSMSATQQVTSPPHSSTVIHIASTPVSSQTIASSQDHSGPTLLPPGGQVATVVEDGQISEEETSDVDGDFVLAALLGNGMGPDLAVTPREDAFLRSYSAANQGHARELLQFAYGQTPPTDTKSASTATPEVDHPIFDLKMAYDLRVTIPLNEAADELRSLSTLRVLLARSVTAAELPGLVHEGRVRDFWRRIASMMNVWAHGFGLGGGAAVLGSEHPYFDSKAAGLSADEQFVQTRANLATSYAVSNTVIGVGGEVAATIVREGGMDMIYNQAVGRDDKGTRIRYADSAEGRVVYRRTFFGFPVGHGLVDYFLKDAPAVEQARMRMISSPAAALSGAIYRAYSELNASEVDVVWLDARTPEKAAHCLKSIDDLRKPRLQAIKGYFTDNVWEGIKGLVKDEDGYGLPGADAVLRALVRTVVISALQSGRIIAGTVPGQWAWLANEVTDLMIGTWGDSNRLPQMVVDRVVAGANRQKARSQPQPMGVVPPGMRRPTEQATEDFQLANLSTLRKRHPHSDNAGLLG